MTCYHWIVFIAFDFCLCGFFIYFIDLITNKSKKDFAEPKGKAVTGIEYSYTVAMMPNHKESAYKHLPTYTAGILFHIGSLVALLMTILLFIFTFYPSLFPIPINWINWIIEAILAVGSIAGFSLLIKRISKSELRSLSNIDDYLANILTIILQVTMILTLYTGIYAISAIGASILFFYMPFSKLKHAFYFFAARIELGIFYGKRGVWKFRKK